VEAHGIAWHQSPLHKAAEFYTAKGDDFWKSLDYHQRFGCVYMDYECFFMIRPCLSTDPFTFCSHQDADAWYVDFVFGDGALPKMLRLGRASNPQIKLVGFTRNNDESSIRFYTFDKH
jgi:hypothetical protein